MSITLEGTSVKYTISTPSVFTINESNIDKLVSAAYTPTVTRNKTGSAATRYIVFSLAYGSSEWNIACWKAVFAANSKTATVTAYNTPFGPARMGDVANDTFNKLGVGIDTSASHGSNKCGGMKVRPHAVDFRKLRQKTTITRKERRPVFRPLEKVP